MNGIEPSSLAWKAKVITVIRHPLYTTVTIIWKAKKIKCSDNRNNIWAKLLYSKEININ